MNRRWKTSRRGVIRRALLVLNAVLFVIAVFVILVVVNDVAHHRKFRYRFDATKTRAYSLSPQTRQLLDSLHDHWSITLLLVRESTDPAVVQQVDEVLQRYGQASPYVAVDRIDPTDPNSLTAYENLLNRLRSLYQDDIDAYETALDRGREAFTELQLFAQQQATLLARLIEHIPQEIQDRQLIVQRAQLLTLLAQQGGQVTDEVDAARQVDETHPIPEYDTARSILSHALTQWSSELYDISRILQVWRHDDRFEVNQRQFLQNAQAEYEAIARQLAEAADPLRHLPPLELAAIGRQLQRGEGAIIIGPEKATMIPSNQFLATSNLQATEREGIRFDQRFRGEQLISATIRSLLIDPMPLVVFMHAESGSLFQPRDQQQDLTGVVSMLESSRFDVAEWIIGRNESPQPEPGQPTVWIVVPPPPGRGLTPSEEESRLINETQSLMANGESVLLSLYPSLLQRYGQEDPWSQLAEPFGLSAHTDEVILESAQSGIEERTLIHAQAVHEFNQPHTIARALNGQQTYFALPIPIEPQGDTQENVKLVELAGVDPSPQRWREKDWARESVELTTAAPKSPLTERVGIAWAVERPHPVLRESQRFILIGSGGWMVSNVADVVVELGGGRVALVNPGNHELILSAVAWLARQDDLIAPSPIGQEIARLSGVSREVRQLWWWIALVGLPGFCLILGFVVWGVRRF